MNKRRYEDPLRPYCHNAPIHGEMITFANVEYPTEKPPMEIVINDVVWRRDDDERD